MKLNFGLDLGNDTVKLMYSKVSGEKNIELGILALDGLEAFPSLAYYDEDSHEWLFGERAVRGDNKSQKPIVKIKELLSLCDSSDRYNGTSFLNSTLNYKFKSIITVKEVVEKFFKYLLLDLKDEAMKAASLPEQIGGNITFTFPSNASDTYKLTLKKILTSLGYNASSIAEPTAAAVSCLKESFSLKNKIMLVDVGSVATSVIVFSPSATQSNSPIFDKIDSIPIGGTTFDNILYDYTRRKIDALTTSIPDLGKYQTHNLKMQIKNAKEQICFGASPYIIEYQADYVMEIPISDTDFEEACSNIGLTLSKEITSKLKENPNVTQLIVTGGGSGNPLFRKQLLSSIKQLSIKPELIFTNNSLFSQAKGAAMFGSGVFKITPISTKSYGLEGRLPNTSKTVMGVVVQKNTKLPCKESRTFSTSSPNQTRANVTIYSSDYSGRESVCEQYKDYQDIISPLSLTKIMSKGELMFSKPVPIGTKIKAEFSIDENGICIITVESEPKGLGKYSKQIVVE